MFTCFQSRRQRRPFSLFSQKIPTEFSQKIPTELLTGYLRRNFGFSHSDSCNPAELGHDDARPKRILPNLRVFGAVTARTTGTSKPWPTAAVMNSQP